VKPRCVSVFCGCSCFAISVVATHIYREDPLRVTTSHNQLGLPLPKLIRHGLVAKINGKRCSWTCEALGQISADYPRARRAPLPIASPRHATPHPARRGERACMGLSPFLHSSTHLHVHREEPTIHYRKHGIFRRPVAAENKGYPPKIGYFGR
jgi:hypothetical protein